jgi:hypothetical protein
VSESLAEALAALDEEASQRLYGRWNPLEPRQVAELLGGTSVRWRIGGGRAARVGAPPRHHDDTDVIVMAADVAELRTALRSWHLWEANSGALRPLPPGVPLGDDCEQFWARRSADDPWQLDLPLDLSSNDQEWVFKRDARVRLPWSRAVHTVDGICYLRPEVALLHKAHLDRPKDQADLAEAALDPDARAWLADALDLCGHHAWAQRARQ